MDEDLLPYYNGELKFLREMGAEFAAKFPKVASRLQLDADRCEDPHVERLLEGFAFLAARVRRKIDDEYPEITEALLGALYPHFQRPMPSMSIVQFAPGPDLVKLGAGYTIESGARLHSRPAAGSPCEFRTVYPVTLWPVDVEKAHFQPDRLVFPGKSDSAVSLLRLQLRCADGISFGQMTLDRLRFYIDGAGPIVHELYELLFNHTCQVLLQGKDPTGRLDTVELPVASIRQVGFERDEGLFPYPERSFPGYRLLQEYFAFPYKFLFFDATKLGAAANRAWGETLDLLVFFDRPPRVDVSVQPDNFRLGCTPTANLFTLVTEPILLHERQVEYRVVPDVNRPHATEIYSIDEVELTSSFLDEPSRVAPFYSMTHERGADDGRAYWYSSRRPSLRKGDMGTEVYLTFVGPDFRPNQPAADTLKVRATCTNRDLPGQLPFGVGGADFVLEAPGPVADVRCRRKPSPTLRRRLGRGTQWGLISHLSLNHLSLVDSEKGLESLRALLSLHDLADTEANRQQVAGITRVSSRRVAGRLGRSACLGMEVSVEFDETQFVGSGLFLLASVLERFLGTYASINAFCQLVATTAQREGILKRWPPRAGERTLL